MHTVQNVVEDFVECDPTFIASLRHADIGSNMLLELFFGYTDRDSAHWSLPLVGFLTYDALSSLILKV